MSAPLRKLLLALALLAPGCGLLSSGDGRYALEHDRAPKRRVDADSIPEVRPVPVVRTEAGNRSPYTVLGKTYTVLPSEQGYSARGVASWYGEKFHGHKTSNGETFDMYKASAAHRSLPIPSFLRVTNLDNGRSIVVRVNDRGPFHDDRIIDLSWGAALKLGFADRGTARVQLEALAPGKSGRRGPKAGTTAPSVSGELYLQVGAFASLDSARKLLRRVRQFTDRPVFIRSAPGRGGGVLHRVRIGPVQGEAEARRLRRSLLAAQLGNPYTVSE